MAKWGCIIPVQAVMDRYIPRATNQKIPALFHMPSGIHAIPVNDRGERVGGGVALGAVNGYALS